MFLALCGKIRVAMDDARKGLPYAPYLMFMIERLTGYQFVKDGLHEQYKIEKARHAKASEITASPSNVPESSRSGKKKNKMVQWIKAIFANAPMRLRGHMRHRWSSGRCVHPQISHCSLHHHLLHIMTCLVSQIPRMRMRRRPRRSLTIR